MGQLGQEDTKYLKQEYAVECKVQFYQHDGGAIWISDKGYY